MQSNLGMPQEIAIDNPFQAPNYDGPPVVELAHQEVRPVKSLIIFLRWLVICVVSAAPSFVLGLILDGANPNAIAGMVCGILLFVVGYTAIEHTYFVRDLLRYKSYRRTAQIGYGTRIGISIVFPVGFYLDMFCGFIAVPVSQWILNLFGNEALSIGSGSQATFLSHFITTVLQGVCLNVVLFGYMLFVLLIVKAAMGEFGSDRHPSEITKP